MKKISNAYLLLLFIFPIFFAGCKKGDTTEDLATIKKNWITGTWKQTDITLAYPVPNPLGGPNLPEGTSLHILSGYLPLTGPLIEATSNNVVTFDAKDSSYSFTGNSDCISWMLPHSAASGTWNLQAYGAALHLVSNDYDLPLWIDQLDEKNLTLGGYAAAGQGYNVVHVAELNADVPVYFVFQKQ
jgi:hypothetical protein